ncbi:hypothetical protein [Caenimonas sp. SL110]|uniref:hypothetical protein n=1 Tax=Caenimonas sp. SL110 TaxID=1450524 RepID=UPI0006541DF6|nr:hypothetical protein [Caenimonas sp. SL110]
MADLLGHGATAEPGQQAALALCHLEAGFELAPGPMCEDVQELLRERRELDDDHWEFKCEKHGLHDDHGRHLRVPYFYAGTRYSLEDRNCELVASNAKVLECRHLQQAAAGTDAMPTKQFLRRITCSDVTGLDRDALEARYASHAAVAPTINFSRDRFGALVQRLALRLEPGQACSFYVGWLARESHSMRLFLRRESNGRIWVGHYDPGVTGNIHHLSLLPEHLARLDFDHFDSVQDSDAPQVLSLAVDDAWMARSCAGAFVAADALDQFVSLCQAIADGNAWEVEKCLSNLGQGPWPFSSDAAAQRLGDGLYHALVNGHARVIGTFMKNLTALRGFTRSQLATIAAARCELRVCGLYHALARGNAEAVRKFMEALLTLGLEPAQLQEIVAARDDSQTPGLYFALLNGHTPTLLSYMTGVRNALSSQEQIARFVQGAAREVKRELDFSLKMADDKVKAAFIWGLGNLEQDLRDASFLEREAA